MSNRSPVVTPRPVCLTVYPSLLQWTCYRSVWSRTPQQSVIIRSVRSLLSITTLTPAVLGAGLSSCLLLTSSAAAPALERQSRPTTTRGGRRARDADDLPIPSSRLSSSPFFLQILDHVFLDPAIIHPLALPVHSLLKITVPQSN